MRTTPLPAGSLRATSLNAARRAADMSTVADSGAVDVLVVGGGITGTSAALDAAARGLSVVVVEAEDLANTTRRPETFHQFPLWAAPGASEVPLARVHAAERHVLMTNTAPHLVRTLPRLVPLTSEISRRSETALASGLRALDALRRGARTPSSVVPAPRRIPSAEAMALAPGLHSDDLRAALLGFDGAIDTARLVVALARTAAGFGARVLTRVCARSMDDSGATVFDRESGESFPIRARSTINATGPWVRDLAPAPPAQVRRRSHLLVDADASGVGETAISFPGSNGGFRTLTPERGPATHLGVVESSVHGPIPDTGSIPEAAESTVDKLLGEADGVLEDPLDKHHVLGTFTEFRALCDVGAKIDAKALLRPTRTSPATHRHSLRVADNVVSVVGGTAGSYRRVAADAVDAALRAGGLTAGPSRTTTVPLVGAVPRDDVPEIEAEPRLVAKYGAEAVRVGALAELDTELGEPLTPSLSAAEVVWAVRHEGALTADDVLDRRGHGSLGATRRQEVRPAVAELVEKALRGVLD